MDASQAHFVRLLEVYEGDDADDADDEGDALGGGAEPAPFAANPRGLPSRFMVGDLRQRPRALTAALRHAAQRQQPAYLHVLVAAPVFESELDPKVAASLAPRWEYLAVQKALFFHFSARDTSFKRLACSFLSRASFSSRVRLSESCSTCSSFSR